MTIPDQVVFSGHGVPMRIPVHVIPGMRHVVVWEIVDELDAPVDMDGTAWTVTMHDAISGEIIYTYAQVDEVDDTELGDHELGWLATPEQTLLLDGNAAYEIRWVRDMPGPDMLAAGPVIFTATTIPSELAS